MDFRRQDEHSQGDDLLHCHINNQDHPHLHHHFVCAHGDQLQHRQSDHRGLHLLHDALPGYYPYIASHELSHEHDQNGIS